MAVLQRCCKRWYALSRERCSKCGQLLAEKKNKVYGVDFYRGHRRERIVVGPNKTRAFQFAEKVRVQSREDKLDPSPKAMRLDNLAQMYLDRARGTKSEKDAKCIFRRLCSEWGSLRTDQITPHVIETLRTQMLSEGKSKRWIDYHTALARSAFNLAHLPNPFVRVRQFNPDTRVLRYLTEDERKALLSSMQRSPLYLQEMLVVSLGTGLRWDTVTHLRREEVDFSKHIIVVRISARTKGTKPHVVPMTSLVEQVLRNIPEDNTGFFWTNPRTGKPYTSLKKSWATLKKRAGITRTFRWHDLKHDFLSRVVTSTGSLRIAQELAGHNDPRITDRYAHLVDVGLHAVVEAVSDILVTPPNHCIKSPTK